MRLVEGGVGHVEVVVPELVARAVAVGGQIQHVRATLTEATVGLLDETKRRFNAVARQPRHQEKALLVAVEALHRTTGERPVAVGVPPILADAGIVGATNKGQLLVETGLVVPTRDAQWNAFGGDQVIQRRRGVALQQHGAEGVLEMGLEGLPVDGLRGRNVASVEDEHAVFADVPRGDKGPPDRPTGF